MSIKKVQMLAGFISCLALLASDVCANSEPQTADTLDGVNSVIKDIPGAVRVRPVRTSDPVKPVAPIQVPGVTHNPVFFTTLVQPQVQIPFIPQRPPFTIG